MKTIIPKDNQIERRWLLVDAEGQVLGRLASAVATVLMGKHRPYYTPHKDCGDFVVVVNAEKIRLTGKKREQLFRENYSGYPGGRRIVPISIELEKHPERIFRDAVRRMLPSSKLGRKMLTKLKVYRGEDHPHQAQNPEPVELDVK